jgi:integrase
LRWPRPTATATATLSWCSWLTGMASERPKWRTYAWEQVDFKTATLHIRRAKNGTPATHPLSGPEMRELRRHQRESAPSPFVFVSERGAPLSAPGFSRLVERAAIVADLGIKAHAHMLRHACGYKLANDGHDTRAIQAYLGHRNIQNTTRYTALAPQRFKEFFCD